MSLSPPDRRPDIAQPAQRNFLRVAAGLLVLGVAFPGCRHAAQPEASPYAAVPQLSLSSASLPDARFPRALSCDGVGTSPELAWTLPPLSTQSFVLIVTDPDAPAGTFVHWVLFGIPAGARELPAGLPNLDQLPDGSRQGRNSDNKMGYAAPCPPAGPAHRYFFDLFALDTLLNLPAGASRDQVEDAMNNHIVARGKLLARYGR